MGGKNRFICWRRAEIALSLMCEISSMVYVYLVTVWRVETLPIIKKVLNYYSYDVCLAIIGLAFYFLPCSSFHVDLNRDGLR